MTAIAATVGTRRSLVVLGAIIAIAIAVLALVVFTNSTPDDMHHLAVSIYHQVPHFVQALFGAQHFGS